MDVGATILQGLRIRPRTPIRQYTEKSKTCSARGGFRPSQGRRITSYSGVIPEIQRSLSEGRRRDAAAASVVRGAGGHLHHVCPECAAPAERGGPARPRSRGDVANLASMQIERPRRLGTRPRRTIRCAALASLGETLDSFLEIGPGYLSLERPWATLRGAQRTNDPPAPGPPHQLTYVFDEPTVGCSTAQHCTQNRASLCTSRRPRATPSWSSSTSPSDRDRRPPVHLGPVRDGGGRWCSKAASDGLALERLTVRVRLERPGQARGIGAQRGALEVPRRPLPATCSTSTSTSRLGVLVVAHRRRPVGEESLIAGSADWPRRGGLGRPGRDGPRPAETPPGTPGCSTRSARRYAEGQRRLKPALFSANSEGALPDCNWTLSSAPTSR